MRLKKEILDKLFALQRFGIKPGLERTFMLCREFGDPHKAFPVLHVAGSNGKGSVCSMIASVLQEAGFKTGLYTSPHLVDFNERIRINGRKISDQNIVKLAEEMLPYSETISSTFFEITTVMAFKYFADNNIDIAVLETGMGGRFDSTNVVDPLISVITSISLEHREYLGNTLEEIAFEKAGIIKEGRPVIIADQHPDLKTLFKRIAGERKSKAEFIDEKYSARNIRYNNDITMTADLTTPAGEYNELELSSAGMRQSLNLKTAVASIEKIKDQFPVKEKALRAGLKNIRMNTGLAGRIHPVRTEPPLILDVAHNPDAFANLIETLGKCGYGNVKWHIIFAALSDKDFRGSLDEIKPACQKLIITKPDTERAMPPEEIAGYAREIDFSEIEIIEDVKTAVEKYYHSGEPLIIAGSFYLLGEAIPCLPEKIL